MNDLEEVWKEIEFNPRYEVSALGNVRKKLVRRRPYNPKKLETAPGGYKRVTLAIQKKTRRFLVHRLVATYFVPNPENKPIVLHKDNDPSNNRATNLRWGTHSENLKQAYDDNRTTKKGEKNSIAVFKEEDILKIRELQRDGYSQKKIGKMYGVNQSHISMIVNRKIWAHV